MPRSPVTNVINAFNALTEDEKKLCLDFIAPEPEPEPQVKQTRKKRTTKSAKAQSLSSVIAKTPKAGAGSGLPCAHILPDNNHCMELEDNPVHDPNGGYVLSHAFVAPAQPVTRRSSRRNGATKASESSTPNSETLPASVGNVVKESQMSASGD